jgi:hypothetical protein
LLDSALIFNTPFIAAINQLFGRWSEQLFEAKVCSNLLSDITVLLMFFSQVMTFKHQTTQAEGRFQSQASRYVGPFEVLTNLSSKDVVYRSALPPHLQRVHNVLYISAVGPGLPNEIVVLKSVDAFNLESRKGNTRLWYI